MHILGMVHDAISQGSWALGCASDTCWLYVSTLFVAVY